MEAGPLSTLAFLVMVAWGPWFTTGSVSRWILLSGGLGLVSEMRLDAFPHWLLWSLVIGFGWMAASLAWSPDPWGGAGEIIGFALLVGTMIAVSAE